MRVFRSARSNVPSHVSSSQSSAIAVVHNHWDWLALTQNWIYTQLRHVSPDVNCSVACSKISNAGEFSWPLTYCYNSMSHASRLAIQLQALVALGANFGRHSALIRWAVRQTGARIVHSHFGFTACAHARAIRRLGLRHVVSVYGVDVSAMPRNSAAWQQRYREMFPLVDRVLCEGPHMAQAVRALGCPAERVVIHHLGVSLPELPFRPRSWRDGQPLRVLIAASFRPKKGIPYALEALGRLRQEQDLRVTVIGDSAGQPDSEVERQKILAVIERHKMCDVVDLLGYQPHRVLIEHAYRNHVFLAPSITADDGDSEGGSPLAITEMAATGMPIVATRHADIPEVIEHGVGGLLAEERDVDGLVTQLRRLLREPSAWQAMVQAARNRIESEYNAERQGRRLAELYHAVLT